MVMSYTTALKNTNLLQVHDIGTQITAFQNTYNFRIWDEFFGRIKKDQADNHVGSTL